jgi:hypothetical protein
MARAGFNFVDVTNNKAKVQATVPVNFVEKTKFVSPLSGSQGSLNSYTNSLAKNFLNESNKANTNNTNVNINNNSGSKCNSAQIPIVNNIINIESSFSSSSSVKTNQQPLLLPQSTPKQGSKPQHQPQQKPTQIRQPSKPMQFINSFVSAVANGAMLMMSSSSTTNTTTTNTINNNNTNNINQSKSRPIETNIHRTPSQSTQENQNSSKSSISNKLNVIQNESMDINGGGGVLVDPIKNTHVASKASGSSRTRENEIQKYDDEEDKKPVVEEEEKREEEVVNPVMLIDVNKKTNRKSYSEVILTESSSSSTATSMNSEFRPRPNSVSLNNFNYYPMNRVNSTPQQQRPSNFFGQYNSSYNNSNTNNRQSNNTNSRNTTTTSYTNTKKTNNANRHSVCAALSAPTFTRNSSNNFHIDNRNFSFTKPKALNSNTTTATHTNNINNTTTTKQQTNTTTTPISSSSSSKKFTKTQTPNVNINKSTKK